MSILDRVHTRSGSAEADVLRGAVARAQNAEDLGYRRFWVAEHHAVPGIAGSAPAVLMAAIAARTGRIRVGSGGIMLPDHQPLIVAEQAATLQALFSGRIDLGVGRSVGFTPAVRAALRQTKEAADRFETDLAELISYLSGSAAVRARPADNGATPVFVLATGKGVDIAAAAGLPVVLGGPALRGPGEPRALERYRSSFVPSPRWPRPYVLAAVNIAVADTAVAARELLLPEAWALAVSRTRGEFPPLESPASVKREILTGRQQMLIDETLSGAVYGTEQDVAAGLQQLVDRTGADELLATGSGFHPDAQADSDARLAGLLRTGSGIENRQGSAAGKE